LESDSECSRHLEIAYFHTLQVAKSWCAWERVRLYRAFRAAELEQLMQICMNVVDLFTTQTVTCKRALTRPHLRMWRMWMVHALVFLVMMFILFPLYLPTSFPASHSPSTLSNSSLSLLPFSVPPFLPLPTNPTAGWVHLFIYHPDCSCSSGSTL